MNRINPARLGLSLAVTVGLLYLLCALMVAIAPGSLLAVLGLVAHGIKIALLAQQVAPISLYAVLVGLLALMVYSFITGLLFGLRQQSWAKESVMQWFAQNWVWVLFFAAFIGMHLFGHARHSGHGGHGGGSDADKDSPPAGDDASRRSSKESDHHHH